MLGLAAATGAPALLLICGCCGLVEPSRRSSAGSEPSADHSRCELEPQDQVAGGRWLLHVGGSRGLLAGLESATTKISGSGRSGVPPNMSTWCIPSGMARGAAQPEHDMALQHHPTHGPRWRARAISTKMQKDAHLHQHKSRPPRQVLGARAGTAGWPGVQGVAGRPGKRFRPRPVAHSPGPTAPEVAEERRTTPGRSATREELVRANGSIIFGETQDLSFFWHVPPAC